jgi:tRNA (cmo5U34)-methyltransferase
MATPTHSVEQHLGFKVEDYDREIRRLVPHYDELLAEGVALTRELLAPDARIVDLGAGTGRLAAALLAGLPAASVIAVDIDPTMLAQARARLAPFHDRVQFVEAAFDAPLPRCDAVVASLALHHVQDFGAKEEIYRGIHGALAAGGVFLCLDATVSDDPALARHTFAGWARAMGEHGIDVETAHRHFADWLREERYVPLCDELAALRRAGFAYPECFWRRGPLAIYGGRRT